MPQPPPPPLSVKSISKADGGARSGMHFKKSVPVHYSANCTNRTRWLRRNRNCCRWVGKDAVRTQQTLLLGAREFRGVLEFVSVTGDHGFHALDIKVIVGKRNRISMSSWWVELLWPIRVFTFRGLTITHPEAFVNRPRCVRPSNEVQTSLPIVSNLIMCHALQGAVT